MAFPIHGAAPELIKGLVELMSDRARAYHALANAAASVDNDHKHGKSFGATELQAAIKLALNYAQPHSNDTD